MSLLTETIRDNLRKIDINDVYDAILNDTYSFDSIGGPFEHMLPSRVLKEMDPTCYRCGLNDWLDSQDDWAEVDGDYYDRDECEQERDRLVEEMNAAVEAQQDELDEWKSELEELQDLDDDATDDDRIRIATLKTCIQTTTEAIAMQGEAIKELENEAL